MTFAIIGTGMIARFHARAIQAIPGATLLAAHNPDPALAAPFTAEFGCRAETDLGKLLADETLETWDFRDERPEDSEIRSTLMGGSEAGLGGLAPGLGANDPTAIDFHQHQRNFEETL